jgi:DNA-binding GntR family transcriptional regulator
MPAEPAIEKSVKAAKGTNLNPLKRNGPGAIREDAYERLKREIISHRYQPGEIVGISELSRDLGVSRTPVREALSRLERDFLVTLIDGRGAVIRPLTIEEIISLNQVREMMDGLAAKLAANRMPDEQIAEFLEKFKSLLRDGHVLDHTKHMQLSDDLHRAITEICGNHFVQSIWNHLNTAFLRLKRHGWQVWLNSAEKQEIARARLNEHLEILQALQLRNPERAETAARQHIRSATEDLLRYMRTPYK